MKISVMISHALNLLSLSKKNSNNINKPREEKFLIIQKKKKNRDYFVPVAFHGYATSSSFLIQILDLRLFTTCSTNTSLVYSALNLRIQRGSHSSLATPRSLQQRTSAFDLQPSVAVGMPSGLK